MVSHALHTSFHALRAFRPWRIFLCSGPSDVFCAPRAVLTGYGLGGASCEGSLPPSAAVPEYVPPPAICSVNVAKQKPAERPTERGFSMAFFAGAGSPSRALNSRPACLIQPSIYLNHRHELASRSFPSRFPLPAS